MFYSSRRSNSGASSFLIDSGSLSPGVPGSPGCESLSFASPKESNQRKGDPQSGPLCGSLKKLKVPENLETSLLRSRRTSKFFNPSLSIFSSPARTGWGLESGSPHPCPLPAGEGGSPNPSSFPQPVLAEPSSADGGGMPGQTCLSEASCLDRRRNRAAQVARSASVGTQTAGRLSFAYFSLAKQRKVSCCRATPALQAKHQVSTKAQWQQEATK